LNKFSNLGKGPETMKVPYAKQWQKETDKLRQIALDCNLAEELKWGKPCFTFLKRNVAIVIPLKDLPLVTPCRRSRPGVVHQDPVRIARDRRNVSTGLIRQPAVPVPPQLQSV
jgi:hypothetical protein